MPNFSIIAAIANSNAIGKNNSLLVHLPKDLQWFKQHTINNTVVMGRKTFDSLPRKPLPNRRNIVLTQNKNFWHSDIDIVNSVDELMAKVNDNENVFVIGGAQIFSLLLPYCTRMYVTRIHKDFDADTFFPQIQWSSWQIVFKQHNYADEKHCCDFDFLIYEKINYKK